MKILYAEEFAKQFKKLPPDVQKLYRQQETFLRVNWKDPRLHTKKLHGSPLLFSFRVTRRYRALFHFTAPDSIFLASIGHRKDIYR